MTIRNTNDGSSREPYLRLYLNAGNWGDLPDFSAGPQGASALETLTRVKDAGFAGVQGADPALCKSLGLGCSSSGRVNNVGDAATVIAQHKDKGFDCATLHVGWGMEDDAGIDRLVGDIINQSTRHDFPLYIETHRATITQDMWRTVEFTRRFPEVRFNGDFSHWYTGLEMVYGGFENKLAFIAPVLERVRFIHGRIGNPGCIQVDIGDGQGQTYVEHFRALWTAAFKGFLKTAMPGDFISFAPELLPAGIYYARKFKNAKGDLVEEGDRWQQAILYARIATECFEAAQKLA